jgi:hypothetical protein
LQHPEVGLNDLVGWHPHGGFDLDHLVHFRARRPGRGNRESGGPSPSTGLNRSSRWETWRSRSSAARCARVSRGKRGCRRLVLPVGIRVCWPPSAVWRHHQPIQHLIRTRPSIGGVSGHRWSNVDLRVLHG